MLEIYTKPVCVWCEKTKAELKERGISFREYIIGVDVTRSWVVDAFPTRNTVPIIREGQRVIGGYTELMEELSVNPNLGKTLLFG